MPRYSSRSIVHSIKKSDGYQNRKLSQNDSAARDGWEIPGDLLKLRRALPRLPFLCW